MMIMTIIIIKTVVKQTTSCTFITKQVTRHIIFMIIMLLL